MDIDALRDELVATGLDMEGAPDEPLPLLEGWLAEALDAGLHNANAMAVASVDVEGQPSVRNVLMQHVLDGAPTFYTNYQSRKGVELDANPRCEAVMSWLSLERQIRITGVVSRLSPDQSDAYFATRPRGSQLAAHASDQSRPLASREALVQRVAEIDRIFDGEPVPRPEYWGGFRLLPARVEFWQGRPHRLHDRLLYARTGGSWVKHRLAP